MLVAVQTFLPYPNFVDALAVLDTQQLGKQRVETLQILRALVLPEYGWRNHPAVQMWQGRLSALVFYGLSSVAEWERRGFADTTALQMAEFAPRAVGTNQADLAASGELPSWLGDERLHRSHRSKLLSKDPQHYEKYFRDVPPDLEYFWPGPDDIPTVDSGQSGKYLWVVQPGSALALGEFLQQGMISVGHGSGIEVDATGKSLEELRNISGAGRRRSNRPMGALTRLLAEVAIGDDIAVQIEGGRKLIIGEIISDYEFMPASGELSGHRRRVRWGRVIPRSAISPTFALQDVRPLFRVQVAVNE